jgi:hypothetical protein
MNFFASMIKQISLLFLLLLGMASCQPKKEEQTKVALPKDSTLELLNARISGDNKNPALYAKRAELWLNKGKSQLAFDDITTAVRLDSLNYDYQFRFSEISFLVGKSRQTKQGLRKMLANKTRRCQCKVKIGRTLYLRKRI